MESINYKLILRQLAVKLKMPNFSEDIAGVDVFLPVLEKMRREGAVIIMKLDGERGEDDNGPYTAIVLGQIMKGEEIRTDAQTVEEALSYIVINYARRFWNLRE